jgi:hypothetical protein
MLEEDLATQLVLACALCMVGTSIGFNRPSWSRTYTTAARFRIALVLHAIVYLVVYLGAFILLRQIFARGFAVPTYDATLSAIWLALLAVLSWRLISSRPKEWLHGHAGIPGSAHRFATSLADGEVKPSAEIAEQARSALLSRGIDVDADWLDLARPTHQLLLRTTMLFLQVREWETQREFARFAREAKNELGSLRRRFDRLSFRVARSLTSIERLGEVIHLRHGAGVASSTEAKQADTLIRKIVTDLLADCCEDIRNFHESACLLAARAALVKRRTQKGRDTFVRALGFDLKRERGAADYVFLVTTAGLLYAGMWLFFQLLPSSTRTADLEFRQLVSVVSLVVFGSLVIAIVPKLRWGFANAGLRRRTPIAFVLGAGICAVIFAVVVQLTAGALLVGGMDGALGRVRIGSSWLLATFLTASTMAWLVQDHRWRGTQSPWLRRLLDGLSLGAAWVLGGGVGMLLQTRLLGVALDTEALSFFVIGSFVFGSLLGLLTAESARHTELRLPLRTLPTLTQISLSNPRSLEA